MRIVIDMQGAQTESRFRGIGRYSTALAQAIVRNAGEHEIWITLNNQMPSGIENVRVSFKGIVPPERIVVFDVPALVSWESPDNAWRRRAAELIRESFLREMRPDIVHVSSLFEGANCCNAVISVGNLASAHLTAVTLYDLIPLLNPEGYLGAEWIRQWYMDKVANLRQADLLLSISGSAREEAMAALDIAGEHIVNISAAHTDNFRPSQLDEADKRELFARYGITLPYLMYSGALESRKNLYRLMQAFALLPSGLRSSHQLLFVGKVSDLDRLQLEHLAKKLKISDDFVLTGYVTDDELVAFFCHCALFVFPSTHEGFGLPALEAMACGAPTIGSNTTSIPEVIGRADALFDPLDTSDIAAKITRALTDADYLLSLRQHALPQAAKFSWDICAKRAITAFEQNATMRSAKPASWADISAEQEHGYWELIDAIAAIPQDQSEPSEIDLIEIARCIANNRIQTDNIVRSRLLPESITWRIEGPFDSSYSLALLNRETARALEALGHRVVLHSTEGPGDFLPSAEFLYSNPDLEKLNVRSQAISEAQADVTSRNLYPPRVADMTCRLNLFHGYGWEESGLPFDWVENFNVHLQGIICVSHHVEKILLDHGVTVPISVSGNGVDHWERINADENFQVRGKTFRFLHVSSCFPRKGADLLLKAYALVFTSKDDVTLIIKTFANPHNQIYDWLAEARMGRSDFPDVLIIEDDLSDSQLKALYEQCHSLVAPSRAEGFGLPLAEAMLTGIPVITTGWSGQLDFCSDETAWLVDYRFELARTHFNLFDSVWAEPDVSSLAQRMREVFHMPPSERTCKPALGRKLLLEKFRWRNVAERLVNSAREWAIRQQPEELRIGWVTSWNSKCGIAAYSAFLINELDSSKFDVRIFASKNDTVIATDRENVCRCWTDQFGDVDELLVELANTDLDAIIVQHNFAFISMRGIGKLIEFAHNRNVPIIFTFHSTNDVNVSGLEASLGSIANELKGAARILVHGVDDLNRLKQWELVQNVAIFPHGVRFRSIADRRLARAAADIPLDAKVIASYGFMLPHKGMEQLIEAIALIRQDIPNVYLLMVNALYPNPLSDQVFMRCNQLIDDLGLDEVVQIVTDFLPDEESMLLLDTADIIVYPYQETAESASGAIRQGLASHRPVACTPLAIFNDVSEVVHMLPGPKPQQIAQGLLHLLSTPTLLEAKSGSQEEWLHAHAWPAIGQRLAGMIEGLIKAN